MGGHAGGLEKPRARRWRTIFDAFEKADSSVAPHDVLRDAIRLANTRVRGLPIGEAGGGRPGSTVVAVLVHSGGTEVAHVGDSRVFLVQQGKIFQLTRDHSMVQEMVQAKILTPDQAAVHAAGRTRSPACASGSTIDVEVELRSPPVAHVGEGPRSSFCSDEAG